MGKNTQFGFLCPSSEKGRKYGFGAKVLEISKEDDGFLAAAQSLQMYSIRRIRYK
ncbi:hypothetical protein [Bacillus thuringiensis]|uniref:hypothetical protein n=1 Tax=Bacillus thuringiensis TaxID=1428 RepID=UPI0004AE9FA6|nr:hypothetical protein [Bacillus thuringiensis]